MNERIKELALIAKQHAFDAIEKNQNALLTPQIYSQAYDSKFAELIIKECETMNIQELSFAAYARLRDRYEEHFGVEE